MSDQTTVVLRLTVHEVSTLCRLLGLQPPLEHRALTEPHSDGAEPAVERGLLAREVIRLEQDGIVVDPAIEGLVNLLSRPALLCRIQTDREQTRRLTVLYATPQAAVAEVWDEPGVLQYRMLDVADLLQEVVTLSGIDDRLAPVGAETVVTTVGALAAAGDAVIAGDRDDAVRLLVTAGADEVQARRYVDALADSPRGTVGVTTMHRADNDLSASVTAWADCGAAGYWVVEQDDAFEVYGGAPRPVELPAAALESIVRVRPCSGAEVFAQVRDSFPG